MQTALELQAPRASLAAAAAAAAGGTAPPPATAASARTTAPSCHGLRGARKLLRTLRLPRSHLEALSTRWRPEKSRCTRPSTLSSNIARTATDISHCDTTRRGISAQCHSYSPLWRMRCLRLQYGNLWHVPVRLSHGLALWRSLYNGALPREPSCGLRCIQSSVRKNFREAVRLLDVWLLLSTTKVTLQRRTSGKIMVIEIPWIPRPIRTILMTLNSVTMIRTPSSVSDQHRHAWSAFYVHRTVSKFQGVSLDHDIARGTWIFRESLDCDTPGLRATALQNCSNGNTHTRCRILGVSP
mmetsp:Transcript_30584/g.70533  ORF Transcript_30584/g.70533 Transcript_30584/m.70533 type:complete len:298 (-) Transcript_30584:364-1257(-)